MQYQEPTQILLLGAGELGLALLPHLTPLPNTHITIGIRTPSKHTALVSRTTSLLQIDLASPSSSLSQTFSAYAIVISATGFSSTPTSVLKLANEILVAGNLRRGSGKGELWFFPWQWGVDYDETGACHDYMPLFKAQAGVRDLLRREAQSAGVVWTVVSTGIFMSFLFEPFWGIVRRDEPGDGEVTVRCLRDWDHGVTVTDVDDIGRVLARILKGDVESGNRVLYVAGDSISYKELANIVERASGRRVVRKTWDVEHLQEEMRRAPDDKIAKYRLAFAGEGVCWAKEGTINRQLDMKMVDVATYARMLFSV